VLVAIMAAVGSVAGCSSGSTSLVGGGGAPSGNSGYDGGSCLRDEPGCACAHEGQVIACGMQLKDEDAGKGNVKCNMGGQICAGGRWSVCEVNSNDPALKSKDGLKLVSGVQIKGLTNPAQTCTNACDPYCLRYPDTAADASGPDGGSTVLGCSDAAVLTVVVHGNPEASAPPAAVLADAGLADGEKVLYLTLAPNQTAVREFFTPDAGIANADIYFLVQDTSSMGPAAATLASALTNTTTGIIANVKTALSGVNTNFGVGRFEDYYYEPYVGYESGVNPSPPNPTPLPTSGCNNANGTNVECINEYNLPYQHLLSMQSDTTAGQNSAASVSWLVYDSYDVLPAGYPSFSMNEFEARGGGDVPEATVSALWALATGNGLYANAAYNVGAGMPYPITDQSGPRSGNPLNNDTFGWWVVPRQYWTGAPVGAAGMGTPAAGYSVPINDRYNAAGATPCTVGSTISNTATGTTWPCFRTNSTPVVVLIGDAPAHQGPGGQYPYVNEANWKPAASNPSLPGANPWPVPPIKGTCPAGYGTPTAGGACSLTQDPNPTDNGLEFATALNLPGVSGSPSTPANPSAPLPGVYYGIVPTNLREYHGALGSYQWYSASSVGDGTYPAVNPTNSAGTWSAGASSGVFNINKTSTLLPGYPQRNSLRDCQGAGGTDDAVECTPSLTGAVTYPWYCYQDTILETSTAGGGPVASSSATYNAAASPITPNGLVQVPGPMTETLPGAASLAADSVALTTSLDVFSTATNAEAFPSSYTPSSATAPLSGNLGWTSGAWSSAGSAAFYGSWTNVSVHAGAPCKVPLANGTPSTTCSLSDGTPVAQISLAPGEGVQNITVYVSGESEGATAIITPSISVTPAAETIGSLAFTTLPSSTNNNSVQGSSTGVFYNDGNATTQLNLAVAQSAPFFGGGDFVQFTVSYQTISVTGTCNATATVNPGWEYNTAHTTPTAYCPSCDNAGGMVTNSSFGTAIVYNAVANAGGCYTAANSCPGGTTQGGGASHQLTGGGQGNLCFTNCANSGSGAPAPASPAGFAPTTTNSATSFTCSYTTCGSNTNGYTQGPYASSPGYCWNPTCPVAPGTAPNPGSAGTYAANLHAAVSWAPAGDTGPGCYYSCGGTYPNAGTGGNLGVCYEKCGTGGIDPPTPNAGGTVSFMGAGATAIAPVNGQTAPYCQPNCNVFNGYVNTGVQTANALYPTYNLSNAESLNSTAAANGTLTCYACETNVGDTGAFPAQTWNPANATCNSCGVAATPFETTYTGTNNANLATTVCPAGGGTLKATTTTNFAAAGYVSVTTSNGPQVVKYTSVTGGATPSFNGCTTAGTGTIASGAVIAAQSLLDQTPTPWSCDSCANSVPVAGALGGYGFNCPATTCNFGVGYTGPVAGVCTLARACPGNAGTYAGGTSTGGCLTALQGNGCAGCSADTCSGLNGSGSCSWTVTTTTQSANTSYNSTTVAPAACAGMNAVPYSTAGGTNTTGCSNYPGYTNYNGGQCSASGAASASLVGAGNGADTGGSATCPNGAGGWACQAAPTGMNPQCTGGSVFGGDGYFGNDIIYSFTLPAGTGVDSRYYYHFALLRQGPDGSGWVTGGTAGSTSVAANAAPFLYLKSANGFVMNHGIDSSYPPSLSIPAAASASDLVPTSATNAGPDGPVLDCNLSALRQLSGSQPTNSDYIVAEIDGWLPTGSTPTTYYLVIDNAITIPGPTGPYNTAGYLTPPSLPAFQYWLQVGGFDDAPANATSPPSYTQPSYNQAVSALKNLQAAFVGIENSGLACVRNSADPAYVAPTTAYPDYETRDFMEKLAYDVGSYDLATGRPYVVSVNPTGGSCNPSPNGNPCTTAAQCVGAGVWGAAETCSVSTPLGMTCSALSNTGSAQWCAATYSATPYFDSSTNSCTKSCTSNADCPMNTPSCSPAGATCFGGAANCCTTPTSACSGVAGLSCAVAQAVGNLTGNLKQNVYLRPISVNAGSTYTPPGVACTPTALPSSASPTCTGSSPPTPSCYGGMCTVTCNPGDPPCASGLCKPSTVVGDNYMPGIPNNYCIDPSVFVQSVQAVSTAISETKCGINTGGAPCATNMDCNATPNLPTCIQAGVLGLATPGLNTCGIPDTGPDTITPQPPYYNASDPPQNNDGMFNLCSPKTTVEFAVTFQMPFQRSSAAQQYEFDLGIYSGASLVGRTRVIIENPALATANFYRYYDANYACQQAQNSGGTHAVWGNFTYSAICPQDGANNYSQIRFCASAASTAEAGFMEEPSTAQDLASTGCYPGEVLIGIATAAPPPNTANLGYSGTCPASGAPGMGPNPPMTDAGNPATPAPTNLGFNVGDILQAAGASADAGTASYPYLRIRMELDPSEPGAAVAPLLYSWNLNIDCIPSE
jgi:hypothetical protein